MEDFYYINARGNIIQLNVTHPIFHIEDSIIKRALNWDPFSKEKPFYIDIDSNSFHTILTYLNCHQEANSIDKKAEKYLELLENEIETNPIILYSMNKLAILDDMTHKNQWKCSLDCMLNITEKWDKISCFVYIVNMLCENKYKDKYYCINKFGKDTNMNTYLKKNIPVLDIKIRDNKNNTINLILGYQHESNIFYEKKYHESNVKKINDYELNNYIEKFGNIGDFTNLFNDIKNLMSGADNITKRYI